MRQPTSKMGQLHGIPRTICQTRRVGDLLVRTSGIFPHADPLTMLLRILVAQVAAPRLAWALWLPDLQAQVVVADSAG